MLAMGYQNGPLAPKTFFWKGARWLDGLLYEESFLLEIAFHQLHPMLHCSKFAREYKQLIAIYCVIHDFEDLYYFPFGYLILEMESLLFYKEHIF